VLGIRKRKIEQSLDKSRSSFFGRIAQLFQEEKITEDTWEELEELLIQADVGVQTTLDLIETLRSKVRSGVASTPAAAQELLKEELVAILSKAVHPYLDGQRMLHIVLVVGVNGAGKTTSIAKLARFHQNQGQKVMLAAADTFRAAAIDQLRIWGERTGTEVIAHQPDADPGAVVYDAIRASQSRGIDVLIIDTAGRLHTKFNLMQELAKVSSIARKQVHQAPHETLLVVDANTGQNGLIQAKRFAEVVNITGVLLAKLDSSAKGGIVFAIANELGLPVHFAGTGEGMDDLTRFEPREFVEALFQ